MERVMSCYNPMLAIDGYKLDHRRQYPPGTTKVYSNLTARSSRVPGQDGVIFLGLQAAIARHLMEDMADFFERPIAEVVHRYADRVNGYLGPNAIGVAHIEALHALGYLPLEFRALPEGTLVPLRVPMFTVENTHPDFAWLVNYFETVLSAAIWMPCTSATTALRYRQLLEHAAELTGSDPAFVDWQAHDFSFRGMPGIDAAALSGIGHLLYFTGTDTMPALDFIDRYYRPSPGFFIGGSVAATEHSVMCAGGEAIGEERETFRRLLNLYPTGVLSIVSDTWDLWHVVTNTVRELRDVILQRDGKLVIRPDSGDPVKILCGDPDAPIDTPARKGVVHCLWEIFGGTITRTGSRLLDPHIGVIYGDSITEERATKIMRGLMARGFASQNVVLGVGSYTYQHVTRDTYGFAMKATWVEINGVGRAIYKRPATDSGEKHSAAGRLAVTRGENGDLRLLQDVPHDAPSVLKPVWQDGKFLRYDAFEVVRARARAAIWEDAP
jgi:nicotinamide phosphoribosyltransferase